MMALLQQLLYSESLSLSWRDVIVPVVRQVVQTVRPDVRNCDDDMDIRQLVHIKKVGTPVKPESCVWIQTVCFNCESPLVFQISGGRKFDSTVVNGFVCTKNIAHKKVGPRSPCNSRSLSVRSMSNSLKNTTCSALVIR